MRQFGDFPFPEPRFDGGFSSASVEVVGMDFDGVVVERS